MSVITAPTEPTHDLGDTRFTSLATPSLGSTDTAVWIAELDPGVEAVPHSLTREEIFVVLAGRAGVRLDGTELIAGRADAIVVPPGVELVLRNLSEDPLKLLCCMPVGGEALMADGSRLSPPWSR
ncbi:cupin domain-containing protein [Microlunatus ginsengisoli]|uniref:Cupin type-2 domain-containing protein n=1 Tax=Microlunatus ginsengisoli TaxID=363863 RepID=A0ABP6ZSJ6_9ACTN